MNQILDLAGFTDPETGRIEAFLEPQGGFWLPPKVVLESDRLIYPCPETENVVLTGDFMFSLYDHGWKTGASPDPIRLLDAFLKLANAKDEQVREFAERWGPLWLCIGHPDCLCSPKIFSRTSDCVWQPNEPADEFRRRSRQVRAALDISASIVAKRKTIPAQWGDLVMGKPHQPLDELQRILLATVVNKYIRGPWGAFLELRWYENSSELNLNPGFGFLPLVWMQVAQVMSGSKGLCRCDGCGKYYVRFRRKPARGRHNFCEDCTEGGRGSKRIWAGANR